jgi:hypothetical protein
MSLDLDRQYRLSRFVQLLSVRADVVAVSHGFLLCRMLLDSKAAHILELLHIPRSVNDLTCMLSDASSPETILNLCRRLIREGFIVPDDIDEAVTCPPISEQVRV